jgi:hypothetical protein
MNSTLFPVDLLPAPLGQRQLARADLLAPLVLHPVIPVGLTKGLEPEVVQRPRRTPHLQADKVVELEVVRIHALLAGQPALQRPRVRDRGANRGRPSPEADGLVDVRLRDLGLTAPGILGSVGSGAVTTSAAALPIAAPHTQA